MIHYTTGNLLEAKADAIVNTVNTVGVMGKGLALAFKKSYPENFKKYQIEAKNKNLEIGKMLVTYDNVSQKFIINFPTKIHWKFKSKIEYIEKGLFDLINFLNNTPNIKSIAIPPLGCGNGGLNWNEVKPLIEKAVGELTKIENVFIFEPVPLEVQSDLIADYKLTPQRAVFLTALHDYLKLGYSINLLVTQKTAYFLQKLGEPLHLKFEKGFYGPYSQRLNHLLKKINGSYIFFDQEENKPDVEVMIYGNEFSKVTEYSNLNLSNEQKERLHKFSSLIDGFESPYGMELLATVSFILDSNRDHDMNSIQSEIYKWTNRKKNLMKPIHIEKAFKRVKEYFPI